MARFGPPCSVCANPSARTAVDNALLTGETVAEAYRMFGEAFGLSSAATYRHARHSNEPTRPFSIDAPEGEDAADQLRLLVAVQTSQLAALHRADEKGDQRLAASASDRINRSVAELTKLAGVDAETVSMSLDAAVSLFTAIKRHASVETLASLAADLQGHYDDASDISNLAHRKAARLAAALTP